MVFKRQLRPCGKNMRRKERMETNKGTARYQKLARCRFLMQHRIVGSAPSLEAVLDVILNSDPGTRLAMELHIFMETSATHPE